MIVLAKVDPPWERSMRQLKRSRNCKCIDDLPEPGEPLRNKTLLSEDFPLSPQLKIGLETIQLPEFSTLGSRI